MIKLIEVYIEEFRGIKKLTLQPKGENFVIHGPNGSGKSGVVDAIDFGLTGDISRLAGKGTGSLSLKTHGPHVDVRDSPNVSLVRLKLKLIELDKTITLERRLNKPKERLVTPDDPTIQAVLDQIEKHSELTLSRREIIKYVLSDGSTRSKDVQALLKLDDLEQIRSAFTSAANSLAKDEKILDNSFKTAKNDFQRHLNIQELATDKILDSINIRRRLLNLTELAELTKDTNINTENIIQDGSVPPFSRATALSDLATLKEHIESSQGQTFVNDCLIQFDTLKQDPTLLAQIKRANFYQQGFDLLTEDEDACPFCDTEWELASLMTRVQMKLKTVKKAQKTNEDLKKAAGKLQEHIRRLIDLLNKAVKIAQAVDKEQESASLNDWIAVLLSISRKLTPIEELLNAEEEIRNLWQRILPKVNDALSITHAAVSARPDNSAELEARDFLIIAQERLHQCRVTQHKFEHKKQASFAAKTALDAYNSSVEETLGSLYAQVELKLADYYGFINQEDEAQFSAKLEHKKAALNFEVDFYNRGLFPPAAYHSEGHQDSMGLCLYLALMQQLMQGELSFVVLDDVVMSVDTQHRHQVCRLFKEKFPRTQFILTTHEQAWHRQMLFHGLISQKSSITFRNWTVEHGPLAEESPEVWVEIDNDLQNNNVSAAAAKLRRHLEYIAREIAERLRAQVIFQGDGNYDLGDYYHPPYLALQNI